LDNLVGLETFMRVIAGTLKGRRLEAPTWEGLRPTSDKLRETLFNILAPRIAGARVLDGYAGTGAVGIEALSRGAAHVTFVDDSRRARALIAANLAHCGVTEGYAIIPAGLTRALATLPADATFDIILLDPPYDQLRRLPPRHGINGGGHEDVETAVAAAGRRLSPAGVLVLEHARRHPAPDAAGPLASTRTVAAGNSALTFYSWPR
jgi:16S rRNA (guanine(966)-N(2))-methyltransferase RsmD